MKSRLAIAAIAAVAALGGTCAFLVPAASATPGVAKAHTLSAISAQEASVAFAGGPISNVQDKDLNKAGKVVGYDLLRVVNNKAPRRDNKNVGRGSFRERS